MSKIKTKMSVYVLLNIFCFISSSVSLFDFDELQKANYGLDIMDQPVVMSNDDSPTQLMVTSIHGQQYQCNYPDVSNNDKVLKEEEQEAIDVGISDLLKPMADGPCLIHTKGWWTYEFCFGKDIRQYHLTNGKVDSPVTNLGIYESEFDWENEDQELEKKRRLMNRYHSQHYVNGSMCDLTNKPRSAEVRFHCESGQGDRLVRIDEPQTCSYQLIVNTMKICHHPFLKPPAPKLPTPISCNPVLTPEEFEDYLQVLKKQEEVKLQLKEDLLKKSSEEYMAKLKAKHEKEEFILKDGRLVQVDRKKEIQKSEVEGDSSATDNDGNNKEWTDLSDEAKLTESFKDLDKAFTDALKKTMSDILGDGTDPVDTKVKFKILSDADDMKDMLKKLKTGPDSGNDDEDDDDEDDDEFDDEDDEDIELEKLLNEELDELDESDEDEEDDDDDDVLNSSEMLQTEGGDMIKEELNENILNAAEDGVAANADLSANLVDDIEPLDDDSENLNYLNDNDIEDELKDVEDELNNLQDKASINEKPSISKEPKSIDATVAEHVAKLKEKVKQKMKSEEEFQKIKKLQDGLKMEKSILLQLQNAIQHSKQIINANQEQNIRENIENVKEDDNTDDTSTETSVADSTTEKVDVDSDNIDKKDKKEERLAAAKLYEKEFLEQYEKELHKMAPTKEERAKLGKYEHIVKKALTGKFDEIIAEAKEELGDEYDESLETDADKAQTSKELSETLESLMVKLHKAEEDLAEANTNLKQANEIAAVTEEKKVSTKVNYKANENNKNVINKDVKAADNNYQGKIISKAQNIRNKQESEDGEEVKEKSIMFIDNPNGQTMSVIIKTGYYDEDDQTIHFFNDDENDGVTNVMYALMGESPQQRKEETRQDNMEKGYNFKFNNKGRNKQQKRLR